MDNRYDTDLVSVLAHDLRTPLNSVRGLVDAIGQFGTLNERQREMLEKSIMAIGRMDNMISDVLEMSRVDGETHLPKEAVDLRAVLRESVVLLEPSAALRGIRLTLTLPDAVPPVQGSLQYLKIAVNNLITNAIKYNQDNGTVDVLLSVEGTQQLVLEVKDSGMGIPEQDLPHIFERFYRARISKEQRIEGTGLGLAIVKTIVEKHGGQIDVQSVVGEGSCFRVVLPLALGTA